MKTFQIKHLIAIMLLIAIYGTSMAVNPSEGEKPTDKTDNMISMLPEYSMSYPYQLPDLDYAYDALAPVIDEQTMRIHHTKHHQGYTRKTNAALKGTGYQDKPLAWLFTKIDDYPASVRNAGGGFYNHSLFWNFLTPEGDEFSGEVSEAIKNEFGSYDSFVTAFEKAAKSQFGSGWAWLVITSDGSLEVTSTANQNNPLMKDEAVRGIPLLNLDVWEHAYYLNYQNERGTYVSNFWDIVNWEEVNKRYKMAKEILGKM